MKKTKKKIIKNQKKYLVFLITPMQMQIQNVKSLIFIVKEQHLRFMK